MRFSVNSYIVKLHTVHVQMDQYRSTTRTSPSRCATPPRRIGHVNESFTEVYVEFAEPTRVSPMLRGMLHQVTDPSPRAPRGARPLVLPGVPHPSTSSRRAQAIRSPHVASSRVFSLIDVEDVGSLRTMGKMPQRDALLPALLDVSVRDPLERGQSFVLFPERLSPPTRVAPVHKSFRDLEKLVLVLSWDERGSLRDLVAWATLAQEQGIAFGVSTCATNVIAWSRALSGLCEHVLVRVPRGDVRVARARLERAASAAASMGAKLVARDVRDGRDLACAIAGGASLAAGALFGARASSVGPLLRAAVRIQATATREDPITRLLAEARASVAAVTSIESLSRAVVAADAALAELRDVEHRVEGTARAHAVIDRDFTDAIARMADGRGAVHDVGLLEKAFDVSLRRVAALERARAEVRRRVLFASAALVLERERERTRLPRGLGIDALAW